MRLSTHFHKIRHDIWGRKRRTFLVSAAILVGVAGTIALFSMGDILTRQLYKNIRPNDIAMVNVFVTVDPSAELQHTAYLERLNTFYTEGSVVARGGAQTTAYFRQEPVENFQKATLYSYSQPFDQMTIEPLQLLEGRYPIDGQHEVMIERHFARRHSVEIGDTLEFRVLSRRLNETWTIVGIVLHPYVLEPEKAIYVYLEDNNYLTATHGYNFFSARFNRADVAQVQGGWMSAIIYHETPYTPVLMRVQDPVHNPLTEGVSRVARTIAFLALLALFVSGFSVINVISTLVAEQRDQIGTMKALGATQLDLILMYMGIAFSYGVNGVLGGLIVGIPGGYFLAKALAPEVNVLLDGFSLSLRAIAIGVGLGLGIPLAAAAIPVYWGTRHTILAAITDRGIEKNYQGGPISFIIRHLPLTINIRQALRNLITKKLRLLFTVLTLAIAVGSFMGIFNVFSTIRGKVDTYLDTFSVELAVTPKGQYTPQEMLALLQANLANGDKGRITNIEPGFQQEVEIVGYEPRFSFSTIIANGYDISSPTPAFNLTLDKGELLTEANAGYGVVISDVLAHHIVRSVGEPIVIAVGGNRAELTIVGVAQFPLEQLWLSWETLALIAGYSGDAPPPNQYVTTIHILGDAEPVNAIGLDTQFRHLLTFEAGTYFTPGQPGVIISRDMASQRGYQVGDEIILIADHRQQTHPIIGIFNPPREIDTPDNLLGLFWQDLAALEGLKLSELVQPQGYFVRLALNEGEDRASAADAALQAIDNSLFEEGVPANTYSFVGLLENLSTNIRTYQAILSAISLLIGVVGALGLLTTLSMSVFERQREIGIMRAIGARSQTIMTQFVIEGLVVGLIAWLGGIPISLLIASTLLDITGLSETFDVTFQVDAALIGFLGMMVTVVLASVWPALLAAQKTVSSIIRYQ